MKRRAAGPLGILAATVLAYLPVWTAQFVWNDPDYVTRPALRSLHGLGLIWTKLGATEQYYPLLHSFFWVQHRLWGNAALGYHLVNVALHALSAVLFGLILERWWPNRRGAAWFAALLFALHPVMAESAAWISEQKNTLSLVFYLLAGRCYLNFSERGRRRDYWLGLGGFICALLSKSVTATLPAALLVVLWWREGMPAVKKAASPLAPWFAAAIGWGLFSAWVEKTYVGAQGASFALSGAQRLLLAARIPWFYLGKLLWPAHLVFIYPRWTISARDPVAWVYFTATVAILCLGVEAAARRFSRPESGGPPLPRRAPLAIILFFLGSLFPTLGFFNVYAFIYSYAADHWDYLPALAIFAGAAFLLGRLSDRWPRTLRIAAAAALLTVLAARTFQEARAYHDAGRFYATIIARNPEAWMAQHNLGDLLAESGRDQAALPFYAAALAARSDLPLTEYNYAQALARLGRPADAALHDRSALALHPGYAAARSRLADAENDLGAAALNAGNLPAAAADFGDALQQNENLPVAWANLGRTLIAAHKPAAAIAPLERALQLNPNYPEAENDLGVVFATLGRPAEAIPHYQAALKLRPDFPEARKNLQLARSAVH